MGIEAKNLLGQRVNNISKELGIPKVTVETVIRGYLKSLTDSVLNGEDIVIDNIVSVKVLVDIDNKELVGRCRLSNSLKSKLEQVEIVRDEEAMESMLDEIIDL